MNPPIEPQQVPSTKYNRLKIAAVVFTMVGIGLFAYFIYAVGISELLEGIARFGIAGFAVIVLIFFFRICIRALTWKLAIHEPYSLRLRDTIPAVIIGESLSHTIPLGILVSGTAKAVAVRKRIPLVAGLSSVATENLFYSFTTGLFLIVGAIVLIRSFPVTDVVALAIDLIITTLAVLIVLGVIMVIRQWHFASETCEWLYRRGIFTSLLDKGRYDVRLFENLIYSFYRRYPQRFLPICAGQLLYHLLGVVEVWFIIGRLSDVHPGLMSSFMLETVSRLITLVFKLIPFMMGVDEAGAQFVGETVALASGVGVTLAVIRKGRILFWTVIGMLLILKRGISIRELPRSAAHE